MAFRCEMCGKDVSFGRQYTKRGLAKKKGGNGRKITGKSARKFRPNIQRMRVVVNGSTQRMKVCTGCLKSGRVQKPFKMKQHLADLADKGVIKRPAPAAAAASA